MSSVPPRHHPRPLRRAVAAALVIVAANLVLWAGHTCWVDVQLTSLEPLVAQIDSLESALAEDDAWLQRNGRIAQEYSEHQQLAERLSLRNRRARAHDALVDAHDARIDRLDRRFYLAPPRRTPLPRRRYWGRGDPR